SRFAPGSSASRFITQFVCSGRKRKPRRRKILSNRLAEAVQERQVPSYTIQPRNESPQGGAVSKPVRSTDRSSLISVVSVSSEFIRQKILSSFCHAQQAQGFVPHLCQFKQGRAWQFLQLEVGGLSQLKKLQQISQSFPGVVVRRFGFTSLSNALLQNLKGRIDLALFSLVGDYPEHGKNIFHRLEMVAP